MNVITQSNKFFGGLEKNPCFMSFLRDVKEKLINNIERVCQFKNISVLTMGGSLYLYNCSIIIIDSIFVFNQAKEGGSIYFYVNLESSNKKLSLIDTIIQNNKAEIGGGIFWINKPPEINSDSQINNNTANIGTNFASIPTRIFINIYKISNAWIFLNINMHKLDISKIF